MFWGLFAALSSICALLVWQEWSSSKVTSSPEFASFQRSYVGVWLAMMGSDWIQGPYVYALYSAYGFDKKQIGQLFIMGYGAAMVLGFVGGSIADKYGRRCCCIAFGVIFSVSCLTKHSPNFVVLLGGRLLGGVATTLLHSVFESWMIATHHAKGFSKEELSDTYTKAYFGNYIVAVAAGLVGGMSVEIGGPVAPFDVALMLLVGGTCVVIYTWDENYGDKDVGMYSSFKTASRHLFRDPKMWMLGTSQALFESVMYTFVFMWTPELEQAYGAKVPHGLVFASFMVACMIGANCVKMLSRVKPSHEYMVFVFVVAALSFLPAVLQMSFHAKLFGFCLFEACVGVYFPSWGPMRSAMVPEENRAAMMTILRIPLNFMVVVVMMNVHALKHTTVFSLCILGMGIAAFCQAQLSNRLTKQKKHTEVAKELLEEIPVRHSPTGYRGTGNQLRSRKLS